MKQIQNFVQIWCTFQSMVCIKNMFPSIATPKSLNARMNAKGLVLYLTMQKYSKIINSIISI